MHEQKQFEEIRCALLKAAHAWFKNFLITVKKIATAMAGAAVVAPLVLSYGTNTSNKVMLLEFI